MLFNKSEFKRWDFSSDKNEKDNHWSEKNIRAEGTSFRTYREISNSKRWFT